MCARGGFEISMTWKDKKLQKLTILSKNGGETTLINGEKSKEIALKKGKQIESVWWFFSDFYYKILLIY